MTDGPVADIHIVGLGMVSYAQITREVEQILKNAGSIYLLSNDSLVEEYCSEFDAEVIQLSDEYKEKERRVNIYERMAERVLKETHTTNSPVVLAVYGHPLFGVSPSKFVIERAQEQGLEVQIKPGISSLDCLYVDLHLDPLTNGVQIYEATDFLLREFSPNPDVPLFLLQIGLLETGLYSTTESSSNRFKRLESYLEQYYHSSHQIKLIKTATYPITAQEQISVKLNEFDSLADDVDMAHTLYVPPVRTRPIQNKQLAKKIDTEEYLNQITK